MGTSNNNKRSNPSATDDGGGKGKASSKIRERSKQKADLTEAKERADEAVRQAEISRLHAVALQTQLTDQHAAAATAEKQLAELQATIDATGGTAGGDYRSASSDGDSGMASEGLSKRTLPEGFRTNLNTHLTGVFCKNKFINNDTLRAYPVIMADACKAMNMKSNLERSIYEKATVREIKYMMSQKRAYCKKMVMKRYKGE